MFKRINKSLVPVVLLLAASMGVHAQELRAGDLGTSVTVTAPSATAADVQGAPPKLLDLQFDGNHELTLGMQIERLPFVTTVDGEPVAHLAQFGLHISF
jgi:hypothetical protein